MENTEHRDSAENVRRVVQAVYAKNREYTGHKDEILTSSTVAVEGNQPWVLTVAADLQVLTVAVDLAGV